MIFRIHSPFTLFHPETSKERLKELREEHDRKLDLLCIALNVPTSEGAPQFKKAAVTASKYYMHGCTFAESWGQTWLDYDRDHPVGSFLISTYSVTHIMIYYIIDINVNIGL